MIRIVVADDHPVVRDGLRALFEALPETEVVAEAANRHEAVRAAVTQRPDVLVMDLAMPDLDGIATTTELARVAPDVAVLVLTMSEDDESLFAALRAGASGYLVKGATKDEILRAVTAVAAGQVIFGTDVAGRVRGHFRAPAPRPDPFPQLTPRERDVLDQLAAGRSNSEIASRLGLSLKTVNNHTSTIFSKLQVSGRSQAIIQAREGGMGRQH